MEKADQLQHYRRTLLERYLAQPGDLRRAAARFDESALHEPLAPGEWSPHQVFAHVWVVELNAFSPRLHRIVAEDDPALELYDEETWMREEYDPGQSIDAMIRDVEAYRRKALALFEGAPAERWNRTGVHPTQGRRTLAWWLEYSVSHVEDHLGQLGWER